MDQGMDSSQERWVPLPPFGIIFTLNVSTVNREDLSAVRRMEKHNPAKVAKLQYKTSKKRVATLGVRSALMQPGQ